MSDQAINNSIDAMNLRGLMNDEARGGHGGKKSWLVALASALGNVLGDKAARLVELSHKLDQLGTREPTGDTAKDQQNAREFQKTMAEFQAESQLFGMISQAASTAIKSIGEGMSSVARKQ